MIKELALGEALHDRNTSDCVSFFFEYVKQSFFTICTNTQLVERWVKDANECFVTRKDNHFASLVGICHSATLFEYKHKAEMKINK